VNTVERISHDEARELLPWLVNDSLDTRECDRVREHAMNCVICRRELADLRNLRASVAAANAAAIPAPDMRRINARIDAFMARENRGRRILARLREIGGNPWRIVIAAQTALLVALATVWLWPMAEEPEFTTLTVSESLPDGNYFRVVFEPNLSAADLSSLLESMHLTIVDGPSGHGVYTLRLASPASEADRDALVASLLSNADVRFAQPVTIGATQ
jgi:hypothetical protein